MALKIGDKIPNFSAKDSNGNNFVSSSVVGIKPVVFYFYPKDNTPGCTSQACGFRDKYEDFKEYDAEIIGISNDSTDSHQKFINQYKLPFKLLSDDDKKIRTLFGVKPNLFGLLPKRVTYVADKNGIIQLIFDSLAATKHISKSLETIKKVAL